MKTKVSPTDQRMWDLFTCAVEGGINYWAEVEEYHLWLPKTDHEPDYKGFYAEIVDQADDDKPHRITRDVIVRGYRLAATKTQTEIHYFWQCNCGKPPLVCTEDSNAEWDFDALDADAIVQLGLFGSVVYG